MKHKITPVLIALLYAFASKSYADDTKTLPELVVSGSRIATKLSETPAAIGVVKDAMFKRDNPETLGEVLNRISGVYWNDLGNEQHSMSIRQPISTNAVYQYLEDGIPIRPLGVFNHNSLNELNISGAESIEVVKGPASSLYGSNAVGGTINFLSAQPSLTPFVSVSTRYDDGLGFRRIDSVVSNTWGDFGLRLSQYSSRRNNNNWQQYSRGSKDSASLRADYAINDYSLVRTTLVHTDLDTAMTGSLNETDFQKHPEKSPNAFTYRKDLTTRANLAFESELNKGGTSTFTFFYRNNDHAQIPSYTLTGCNGGAKICQGTENNNHVDSVGIDIKHQQAFDFSEAKLISGLYLDKSGNAYSSNNLNVVRDPITNINRSYSLANDTNPKGVRDYEADIINAALYSQFEFSALNSVRIVAGIRADTINYAYTNRLSPEGSSNFGAPNGSRRFVRISPKLGITYSIDAQTGAYGNLSQGFTPPEISQLYGKTGIPDLRPATYSNIEFGVRSSLINNSVKLDAAVYELKGHNTIVGYSTSPGVSENRNAGQTHSRGIELGVNYDSFQFDGRLAASFSRHRFNTYQISSVLDYSGKEMPQAPHTTINAELGYRPVSSARFALEAVHQGRYWMNNANTVRYDGHTLLNFRGSYQLGQGWDTWIHIRNLTRRHYADSASSTYSGAGSYAPDNQNQYTAGAPRSVMFGLTYSYKGK